MMPPRIQITKEDFDTYNNLWTKKMESPEERQYAEELKVNQPAE